MAESKDQPQVMPPDHSIIKRNRIISFKTIGSGSFLSGTGGIDVLQYKFRDLGLNRGSPGLDDDQSPRTPERPARMPGQYDDIQPQTPRSDAQRDPDMAWGSAFPAPDALSSPWPVNAVTLEEDARSAKSERGALFRSSLRPEVREMTSESGLPLKVGSPASPYDVDGELLKDFCLLLDRFCKPGQQVMIKLLAEMLLGLEASSITREKVDKHIRNFVVFKDPSAQSDVVNLVLSKLSGRGSTQLKEVVGKTDREATPATSLKHPSPALAQPNFGATGIPPATIPLPNTSSPGVPGTSMNSMPLSNFCVVPYVGLSPNVVTNPLQLVHTQPIISAGESASANIRPDASANVESPSEAKPAAKYNSRKFGGRLIEWWTSSSPDKITVPSVKNPKIGLLYFHHNNSDASIQAWIYRKPDKEEVAVWDDVSASWKDDDGSVLDPLDNNRVLTRFGTSQNPAYNLRTTYQQSRRGRPLPQ